MTSAKKPTSLSTERSGEIITDSPGKILARQLARAAAKKNPEQAWHLEPYLSEGLVEEAMEERAALKDKDLH